MSPAAAGEESRPFWDGLREHRIMLQACEECSAARFPPRPVCPRHPAAPTRWIECRPSGRLVSWIVVHRSADPAFAARVPYAVLLVEFADHPGLLVYGNLVGDPETLRAGVPLDGVFDDVDADVTLLQWRERQEN